MPIKLWRALLRLAVVLALVVALKPFVTFAQTAPGLQVGGGALVANAGGEQVMLRDGPGYDANVLAAYAEGTPVDLIDGPISAQDGSVWFGVVSGGQSGFMVVDYLAPTGVAGEASVAAEPAAPAAAEPVTAAQMLPATASETAVANDSVNLRAEPSGAAAVLGVVPPGAVVTRNGDAVGGFAPVLFDGIAGWVALEYLTIGDGSAEAATVAGDPALAPEVATAPAPGDATLTTSEVNLRAGPSLEDAVLTVVPAGASVTPTGESAGGYLGVSYQGIYGWMDAAYLGSGAAPAAEQAAEAIAGDLETTDSVNLRAGPSLVDPVLTTLPSGAALDPTGEPVNGFYPVSVGGFQGWVAETYVGFQDAPFPDSPDGSDVPTLRPTTDQRYTGLIWPVTGDLWYISQGYNGSSHQNSGSLWQYGYSFDLAKVDGSAAGEAVISPANGTVRWLDPSTGGISIDIGNGHAVALFHVTVDGGWQADDPINQGDYIGTISGPGGPGGSGFPHVHFALWETTDGGNWSRVAAPFTGAYAISGQDFPDVGGGFQHQGVRFRP